MVELPIAKKQTNPRDQSNRLDLLAGKYMFKTPPTRLEIVLLCSPYHLAALNSLDMCIRGMGLVLGLHPSGPAVAHPDNPGQKPIAIENMGFKVVCSVEFTILQEKLCAKKTRSRHGLVLEDLPAYSAENVSCALQSLLLQGALCVK